jgi:two-component system, NtrC family, sensor kinase
MLPTSLPRAPLARSTLLKMGARVAVIILLSTLFSFLHMRHTLRLEALGALSQHVAERALREDSIFQLARDNHAALRQALEERIHALTPADVDERFARLFTLQADGSVRNCPGGGYDGTRQPWLLVPRGLPVDADMRRRILASYDVLTQYGAPLHVRFTDTFITLPEGPFLVYWPDRPHYCAENPADFSAITLDYFLDSRPERNPDRDTRWSGVYQDEVSAQWMVTATTPLDLEGRHVLSISHDILLSALIRRTQSEHLPGAYNLLFREDGELIAAPGMRGGEVAGSSALEAQQELVRALLARMKTLGPGASALELPEQGHYAAVARLEGTGWYFATILPSHVVAVPAVGAARVVGALGVLSLLLELFIMYWVLREEIAWPLLGISRATARIAAGEFPVELETGREDELGLLARSFRVMADRVQQREVDLRAANEGLEQRVEERARELREVHQQLVQTARRAGMAEVATNVLHNVGNVLTSVYTSAQVAKERLVEMRLGHVARVSALLSGQSDLSGFLQDERGRQVLPFLNKLGENLLEERAEVVSLLDDVGRYTEHVGEIIKVQQDLARVPRVSEPVRLDSLLEDVLRIHALELARHHVKVERHLVALPPLLTDKHKLMMILVNLVSNARHALDASPTGERRLSISLARASEDRVHIELRDNGMGIAPEMLLRIFQYGFTTRQEGHGFGLHSSALAAQELGGSLRVHSEGLGQGATFTLDLPYLPASPPAT